MDKPFKCNLCSFETHKSFNLNKHKKLHEKLGVGPPEMLECSECDKAFITQLNLKMHMKTHIELRNEQSGPKKSVINALLKLIKHIT